MVLELGAGGSNSHSDWVAKGQTAEGQFRALLQNQVLPIPSNDSQSTNQYHRYIPIIYAQLIDQFRMEAEHANYNQGHEALRRGSYVLQVLIAVAEELIDAKGITTCCPAASAWRSKVLNPILQRQLAGVPDAFLPTLTDAVREEPAQTEMSIKEATIFYLSIDPTDPTNIPDYRDNLIFSRELRWYLAVLKSEETGATVEDVDYFNQTLENQDAMLDAVKKEQADEGDEGDEGELADDDWSSQEGGPRAFNETEILVIVSEKLDFFFDTELVDMVRIADGDHRGTTPLNTLFRRRPSKMRGPSFRRPRVPVRRWCGKRRGRPASSPPAAMWMGLGVTQTLNNRSPTS